MHSSRMCTASCSARGVYPNYPIFPPNPLDADSPWMQTPQMQTSLDADSPDADLPGCRPPPGFRPAPWMQNPLCEQNGTRVKTLPCPKLGLRALKFPEHETTWHSAMLFDEIQM